MTEYEKNLVQFVKYSKIPYAKYDEKFTDKFSSKYIRNETYF